MCYLRVVSLLLLLQFSYHRTMASGTDEYSNNVAIFPRTRRYRIKSGSSISLSCNKAKNDVAWQFKSCGMNYKGINCEGEDGEINIYQESWTLLKHSNGKKLLRIQNASLNDVGIYRCLSGNLIRKIFVLEIDAVTFEWPPPKVISLVPNRKVIHINDHLTMNCSVSSRTPPKILWFKVCWTSMCEIDFAAYEVEIEDSFNCLCLINSTSEGTYNWGDFYVSKLHIFNTHVWDGGTYVCSALSSDGKDYKNVTVTVEFQQKHSRYNLKSYMTLLFIPLIFILLYIISYVFCAGKRKNGIIMNNYSI